MAKTIVLPPKPDIQTYRHTYIQISLAPETQWKKVVFNGCETAVVCKVHNIS